MSAATPTKRRAALGSLDINVTRCSPSTSANKLHPPLGSASPLKNKTATTTTTTTTAAAAAVVVSRQATPTPSPARNENDGTPSKKKKKRAFEDDVDGADVAVVASPAFKKLCSATTSRGASPVKKDAKVVVAAGKSTKAAVVVVQDATDEDSPPASQPSARQPSISPDRSSLFDTSTINTSQLTTITEPDGNAPILTTTTTTTTSTTAAGVPVFGTSSAAAGVLNLPPPRPRRMPTREEMRQKAEILKLRLSLANYKVKTNQTDVPLDKLQIRPVPGMTRRCCTPLPSMSAHTVLQATPAQYWYRSLATSSASSSQMVDNDKEGGGGGDGGVIEGGVEGDRGEGGHDEGALLPHNSVGVVSTPRKWSSGGGEEEARLTSSALRGGAAKGLLSLSQASS